MSLTVASMVFGCTLLTVCAFLFADFGHSITAEKLRLENTATVFAANVSQAVEAGQPENVRAVLRGIRDIAHVRYVSVHDAGGVLIAEMGGGVSLDSERAEVSQFTLSNMFFLNDLTVEVPVRHGGRIVASVTLQAGIDWIREEFRRRVYAALLLSGIGIALAFSMAFRRVLTITGPLSELAKSFTDIGSRHDLSYRLEKKQDDEVGVLADAFNDMFGRIAERDARLQMHRDTLEQTVAERTSDLVFAKDEAERANAAKSEFLAMVGHEIRTPMNGMMVMAEMLAAAPLGPRHLRYAEIINRSGRNMLSIINDILDLSKIEAGRLDLETAPFCVDSLIEDVAGLFSERAREKGLALAFTINPNVPAKLRGDVTRLTQIVTNLVNNALKFTEAGGVTINVSSTAGQGAGQAHLTIRVRDTGIGIAPDRLEHVFERFAQADQSITRRFGGTGLGLAISKRLAEAMGGSISVDSLQGTGSKFTVDVTLPIEEPAGHVASLAGKQIAVAHANAIHRDALRSMLQRMGAAVFDIDSPERPEAMDALLLERGAAPALPRDMRAPLIWLTPHNGPVAGGLPKPGTHVELCYPLRRTDYRDLAEALCSGRFEAFGASRTSTAAAGGFAEFRGLSALVVDDNAVNREVLREALINMNASVELANDGAAALGLMRKTEFDIVFMDCSMPVMDGFAATRKWRAGNHRRHIPIIALTAYQEGSAKDDWRAAGMDDYVTKPFTMPSIAQIIMRHVSGKFSAANAPTGHTPSVPATTVSALIAGVPLLDQQTVNMIAKLSARSGHGAAQRIFGLFMQHAPAGLADLETAIVESRFNDVKLLAHALKSMSTSAGASLLARLADEAEIRSDKGEVIGGDLIMALSEALRATIAAFNTMLAPAQSNGPVDAPDKSVA